MIAFIGHTMANMITFRDIIDTLRISIVTSKESFRSFSFVNYLYLDSAMSNIHHYALIIVTGTEC